MPAQPAIFLDRDGTLNRQIVRNGKPYPPATPEDFQLFPDVRDGCRALHAAGFVLVVATNQPDVARGTQTREIIEAMHRKLLQLIPELARIEVSWAPGQGVPDPRDYRRKPSPGMLTDAASDLDLDLAASWMIGDRAGDIEAGHAAGCRTVWIDRDYTEKGPRVAPTATVRSFGDACKIILSPG